MTLEAILAYLHLLAILTMVVFISSEAALCRIQWLNAAVVERLARVDMVYGIAAIAVLATGIARTWWGVKGTAWYWTNPLLHLKLALFIIVGVLSISDPDVLPLAQGAARQRHAAGRGRHQEDAPAGDGPGPSDRADPAGGGVLRARLRQVSRFLNKKGPHAAGLFCTSFNAASLQPLAASASHFFMKLLLAAPANALPFLSTAFVAQAGAAAALLSFSHFLTKLFLAAPANALPFLSTALASQLAPAAMAAGAAADAGALSWACAAPKERQAPRATRERSFFMVICPCKVGL